MERRTQLIAYLDKKLNQTYKNGERVLKETHRTTYRYSNDMGFKSEEDFILFIRNKTVLDVGSGKGGLAKSLAVRDLNSVVVSLNPRLANSADREAERTSTSVTINTMTPTFGSDYSEIREKAQTAHDKFAVAGYAQFMPLASNMFDVVLDSHAILYYVEMGYPFLLAFLEMWRVAKPGGMIIMKMDGLTKRNNEIVLPKFAESIFKDLGINYEYRRRRSDDTSPLITAVGIKKNIPLDPNKIETLKEYYIEDFLNRAR